MWGGHAQNLGHLADKQSHHMDLSLLAETCVIMVMLLYVSRQTSDKTMTFYQETNTNNTLKIQAPHENEPGKFASLSHHGFAV